MFPRPSRIPLEQFNKARPSMHLVRSNRTSPDMPGTSCCTTDARLLLLGAERATFYTARAWIVVSIILIETLHFEE